MIGKSNSRLRWNIIALLFFATTINYIDRQIIGLLKPYIDQDLHWDEADYGYIVTLFQISYAAGLILSGQLLDKLGIKLGYGIAVIIWSVGAMLHAAVGSVWGFGAARAVLGLGEAANFPAAIKAVAEWFPKKDRAFATGIFNAGSTIGAIVAPIVVTGITLSWGWKWAFLVTGALGFLWIVCWFWIYKAPHQYKGISEAELAYIASDRDEEACASQKISWGKLFRYRQTYIICLTRFLTDWVWWFFLFWIPDFLNKTQGVDLKSAVLPLIVIYTLASGGGIFGGALSSRLMAQGRSLDYARKTAILVCATLILPLVLVTYVTNLWGVVILIGFAAAAHQGWASNIFTVVSDVYPKKIVGSMVGLSGFSGAIGGALGASFVGLILKYTGSYALIFLIASSMYLLAWLLLRCFVRIKEMELGDE